ncbi:MAG: O-antigen ligase family protein [Sedimentisphaerales bacterium]|nr:O-antigen ligase family protein [Sedimentisphaerales bacterium]
MEAVTLAIALTASILVVLLSPVYGLIVYIASFAWYPQYLSIQLGTLDFTVRRIVIIAIFIKLIFLTNLLSRFKFIWLDLLVIAYFISVLIAGVTTAQSFAALLENRAGQVFDTILPYFAVRMIIKNKQQYFTLLKGIMVIAVPLAIIGFYQCLTGVNPVGFLKQYARWVTTPEDPWLRAGFFRADVTFEHYIMYGLFFAMFGPVCAGILRNVKKYKSLYWIGLGFMGLGIFSSMSAGPILVALLAIFFILLYRYRKYWKIIAIAVIVLCVGLEIVSNRHFYDFVGDFTFSGGSAWYRSRLIDVAIFEGGMSGHWLTGYGHGVDPGWCARIDKRKHTDLGTNQYLSILSSFGLVGFVPFLAINIVAAKRLIDVFKTTVLDSDRRLIWCLSAAFFGLAGGFMTVSIFGQPTTIYYIMLGLAGIMPLIITQTIHQRF